jgi:hypothetical protein
MTYSRLCLQKRAYFGQSPTKVGAMYRNDVASVTFAHSCAAFRACHDVCGDLCRNAERFPDSVRNSGLIVIQVTFR